MQFFMLAPISLLLYKRWVLFLVEFSTCLVYSVSFQRWRNVGLGLLIFGVTSSMTVTGIISAHYNLQPLPVATALLLGYVGVWYRVDFQLLYLASPSITRLWIAYNIRCWLSIGRSWVWAMAFHTLVAGVGASWVLSLNRHSLLHIQSIWFRWKFKFPNICASLTSVSRICGYASNVYGYLNSRLH